MMRAAIAIACCIVSPNPTMAQLLPWGGGEVLGKTVFGGRMIVISANGTWNYEGGEARCFDFDVGLGACETKEFWTLVPANDPDSQSVFFRSENLSAEVWNDSRDCNNPSDRDSTIRKERSLGQAIAKVTLKVPDPGEVYSKDDPTYLFDDHGRQRLMTFMYLGESTVVATTLAGKKAAKDELIEAQTDLVSHLTWFPGLYHKAFDGVCLNGQ